MHCFDGLWPEDLLTVNTNLGLIVICLLRLSFFQWLRTPRSADVYPSTHWLLMCMWEPVGPLHASTFDEQISEASPVSNSSVPGCTSADRGRVRRSPPTSNPFCLSFDRVFVSLFAVKMSSDCFEPSSFFGLASHLATLSDPQRIVYFRQLGLLPSHAICGKCQAQTVLDVPDSDNHKDRKRFTSCKQTLCSIFCFTFIIPPADAAVLVGGQITAVHAS